MQLLHIGRCRKVNTSLIEHIESNKVELSTHCFKAVNEPTGIKLVRKPTT